MQNVLYICGDSFCSKDAEYGKNWPELLAEQCPNINVINLSIPGASNYLIYLQVKEAIKHQANYIIFHASGSFRNEFSIDASNTNTDDKLDRYWNITNPTRQAPTVCCSWTNPWNFKKHNINIFSHNDVMQIINFFKKRIDIPSLIEKNYIFINYTLQLLDSLNIPFAWSQGGFEHKKFNPSTEWNFTAYKDKECKINLWDYSDSQIPRPYYHITDKQILQDVCNEYINMLNLTDA